MGESDRLRKLIDEFNRELCWAGCGVECETREERRRLEAKVKDKYAQAIAAMLGDEYKRGYEDGLHANTKAAFAAAKQAMAVTLDDKTELNELLDEFERECFKLRVEASETRAKDDVVRNSYERIRDEFAGRIAATPRDTFAEHLAGVTQRQDERIAALEALVRDMWDALNPPCADTCPHCECKGCPDYDEPRAAIERRIRELGVM